MPLYDATLNVYTAEYETHNPVVQGSPGGRESANVTFLGTFLSSEERTHVEIKISSNQDTIFKRSLI
jgi:hypothetical protein